MGVVWAWFTSVHNMYLFTLPCTYAATDIILFISRRHNFHIFSDVIKKLGWKQEELREVLTTQTYHIKTSDFCQQVRQNPITKHSRIIQDLSNADKNSEIELIPLSNELRQLLSIEVVNIDD